MHDKGTVLRRTTRLRRERERADGMLLTFAQCAEKLFVGLILVLRFGKCEGDGNDRGIFTDETAVEVLRADWDEVQSDQAIGCSVVSFTSGK